MRGRVGMELQQVIGQHFSVLVQTGLPATTETLLSSLWVANQISNRYKAIPLRSRLPVIVLHL